MSFQHCENRFPLSVTVLAALILGLILCPFIYVAFGALEGYPSTPAYIILIILPPFLISSAFLLFRLLSKPKESASKKIWQIVEILSWLVIAAFTWFVSFHPWNSLIEWIGLLFIVYLLASLISLPIVLFMRKTALQQRLMKRPPIAKAGIVLGVAFLLVAGCGHMDLSTMGFPDGHLTDFGRETYNLRFKAIFANAIFGFIGIIYGFRWIRPSRIMKLALVLAFVVVALPSVLLPSCAILPGCPQVYETVTGRIFNDGSGG